jgi:hypothetical protein
MSGKREDEIRVKRWYNMYSEKYRVSQGFHFHIIFSFPRGAVLSASPLLVLEQVELLRALAFDIDIFYKER